ncbi:MAG: FAD-dependent oxidoreductase [Nocardioides sp.]|uniref:NAD(P)/FAD-dependent oxidoreductase n=1 Tax=Nocardioides sp. TaxID=35761 RepID=UPI0039E3EA3E
MDYDAIVVGGGLAGLTAGLYAARSGLRTLVIEQMMAGGQVSNIEHIETFPGQMEPVGGMMLGPATQMQAEQAGAGVVMETVTGLEREGDVLTVHTAEGRHSAAAVIVASGSTLRTLGVPGEEEYRGRGVSQCADCDGYFFSGKRVVVVGGGDSALDEAMVLAGMGVEKVLLVHRGDDFAGAQQLLADRVKEVDLIEPVFGTELVEIKGEDGAVGAVTLRQGERTWEEQVAGVFVFAGLVPNTAWLGGLVDLDRDGRVVVDAMMATSVPGVFAAGDVRQHSVAQLAASAGDGATAGIAAARYLRTR